MHDVVSIQPSTVKSVCKPSQLAPEAIPASDNAHVYTPTLTHQRLRTNAYIPMLTQQCLHTRCITDMQPRGLDAQGQSLLTRFAGIAAQCLEQAAAASSQAHQAYVDGHAAALSNAIHGFTDPIMLCDISNQQHWRVLAVNEAWVAATGICRWAARNSLTNKLAVYY